MDKKIKILGLTLMAVTLCGAVASAQTSNFNLGKNLDIQHSILKNLSSSYDPICCAQHSP